MHITLVAISNIFHKQNVDIPFQNCFAKLWNLAQNETTKLTYKQTIAP
jgi:hypothetical protein